MKVTKKVITNKELGQVLTKTLNKAIKKETKAKAIKVTKGAGFNSIARLVVEAFKKDKEISYDVLTKQVKKIFPNSKWQKTHYAWYKSAIRSGRVK